MVVYVDDMLLLVKPKDAESHWRALDNCLNFKDPESPLTRYLGASYTFDEFNSKGRGASRVMKTDMDEYAKHAVLTFKKD